MATRRKRSFPGEETVPTKKKNNRKTTTTIDADEHVGGVFGFFMNMGVRETIESVVIAIVLAMMFKAFEAEAFIIPTGSMAPSLQGQHKDLPCDQCGYQFQVGASHDAKVARVACPMCRYTSPTKRKNPSHATFNGDRILVNKFVYDFAQPQRYDVIVFKNPNHAKQNYIKRLVGLPGENILIENGDIYTMTQGPDGVWEKFIQPKPAKKLLQVAERIADTDFYGGDLRRVNWPLSWQQRSGEPNWTADGLGKDLTYTATARPETSWLRFSNNRPDKVEWQQIEELLEDDKTVDEFTIQGRLVNDYVAHNDGVVGSQDKKSVGFHWVGDIGFEAEIKVSGNGNLSFDIVEGGAHFTCTIDVQTGKATLAIAPPEGSEIQFVDSAGAVVAQPQADTELVGAGDHQVRFFNADDRLYLWVDGTVAKFDAADYRRSDIPVPHYSAEDPGDAQPLGIGCQNLDVTVNRISCFRDIYYTSVLKTKPLNGVLKRFHRFGSQRYRRNAPLEDIRISNMQNESMADPNLIYQMMRTPEHWNTETARQLFVKEKRHTEPMFVLEKFADDAGKDQFLPMGDNSAESLDGRVWPGPRFVEREMLIGRALFVFWPHSLNEPLPFFPNFKRMKFIR